MATTAFFTIVDALLETSPVHSSFNLAGRIGGEILMNKRDSLSQQMNEEINNLFTTKADKIFEFVLSEKYFRIDNQATKYVVMTEKGERAKELGGHEAYLKSIKDAEDIISKEQNRKERNKKLIEWPQKHWYIPAIVSAFLGAVFTKYVLPERKEQTNQLQQPIPRIHDTLHIFHTDTIYRIDTVIMPSKPTAYNSKNKKSSK
jgi:hypothetical protein